MISKLVCVAHASKGFRDYLDFLFKHP